MPVNDQRRAPAIRALLLALSVVVMAPWGTAYAQADGAAGGVNAAERVDAVWRLVESRYWDLSTVSVDWAGLRDSYAAAAGGVNDEAELHELLTRMVAELGDEHSRYVPPDEVARVRDAYGDLPCVGVFSQAAGGASRAAGAFGPVRWRTDGRIGIVRLADLAQAGTSAGVRDAVVHLERAGVRGLILDLRGNPGGRLVEMMRTAGVFVRGLLWRVTTRWSLPLPYPALGTPASDLPLAVLVDGSVASAAEGLAGALQASGRAVIVGERTMGNVEAVLPFCLRDGAQVWLATGVLAPLGGATWEGRGVEPDLAVAPGDALEAALELLSRQP